MEVAGLYRCGRGTASEVMTRNGRRGARDWVQNYADFTQMNLF
ncbi:MAG: hypothetical protein WA650_18830 [Bradyrhizobium sp.]